VWCHCRKCHKIADSLEACAGNRQLLLAVQLLINQQAGEHKQRNQLSAQLQLAQSVLKPFKTFILPASNVSGPDLGTFQHCSTAPTDSRDPKHLEPTWNRLHCHRSNKRICLSIIKPFICHWLPCHVDVRDRGRLCMSVAVVSGS
jgi:hypothetical protein